MNTEYGKMMVARVKAHPEFCLKEEDRVGIAGSIGKNAIIEDDGRTLEVIATTDDIDLQNEVVLPGGADISYFKRNGKLFADHKYDTEHTCAFRRSMTPFSDPSTGQSGWKVRAYMFHNNDYANAFLEMAKLDSVGCSIGFQALDYGPLTAEEMKQHKGKTTPAPDSIVRRWKWLELSFTPFPCNVNCQTLSVVRAEDRGKAMLDMLVCQNKIKRHVAIEMGLPDTLLSKKRVAVC